MTIQPATYDFYYKSSYWNDYPIVYRELNRRVSGSQNEKWYEFFYKSVGNKTFEKALFLNCGNGWLDREIYQETKLFKKAIGIDCSDMFITEARDKAQELPLRYHLMDINTDTFPDGKFDLVINHAAAHHMAFIDNIFRRICDLLTPDGVFLNYDYVGPHRNQYPYNDWSAVWQLNNEIPENLRKDLVYPHLPTMLATDPTEAIHSELILRTFNRYFQIGDHKHIGGALAYPILYENYGMQQLQRDDSHEAEFWLNFLMDRDAQYLSKNAGASYFDYFYGYPRKQELLKTNLLDEYSREESVRESAAIAHNGYYYKKTLLQEMANRISDLELQT